MKYTELTIKVPENEIDLLCEKLTSLGCTGFIIENESDLNEFLEENRQYWDYVDEELTERFKGLSRVKYYAEDTAEGEMMISLIKALGYPCKENAVDDSDWENNWKQYYAPIEIGDKLIVVPEWEDNPSADRLAIRLDPGLMFGTGSHATTRMCLEAIEKYASDGRKVLDLGCGSGILGIGALVLGCKACVGCDIDPKAPDIVMENAALNGIGKDRLEVFAGDILGDSAMRKTLGGGYDIVLANIVSDVIIPLAPLARGFMGKDAVFITSGIIDGRENEVKAALESAGFKVIAHHNEEEWHCFECVI